VLKFQSRHHALGREELDDVGLFGGHHEFIRFFTEYETDQTVRTVGRTTPHTVVTAN
jgi:hypothetical protein